MKILPKTRTSDILEHAAGDELIIYDLRIDKVYNLNETSKIVFNACDGKKTFANINLPEDVIYLSLDELKKQNLIETNYASPFVGMNRREVIRKAGLASMVALPVISSLVAPTAANAASGKLASCDACITTEQCSSNRCLESNNASGRACGSSFTAQRAFQKKYTTCDTSNFDQRCSRLDPSYCCSGSATSGSTCGTANGMPIYTCICN